MKITNITKLKVLAKSSRTTSEGKTFYQLAVLCGGEAGNISCNEEVFKSVTEMQDYDFTTTYNTEYKSFSVNGVLVDSGAKVSAPATK